MGTVLRDAAADLLLGGRCVGCARPGRLLCPRCRAALPSSASVQGPDPPPAGLATTYAAGPYDGLLRALVLGHKEHRLLALAPVLGGVLAAAVATGLRERGVPGPAVAGRGVAGRVVLVPVPSRPATVRARGHDPTWGMTRDAARRLGTGVDVVRLLRSRPGVVDQAGLDAAARRANLAGSMACCPRTLTTLARRGTAGVHVVVCDDVVTTGSTAREAQRALEAVGLRVLLVATVAATPRRCPTSDLSGQTVSRSPATH